MTSELKAYRVLRGHEGDRVYAEGEIRIAMPAMVAHLVGKVLEPCTEPTPAPAAQIEPAAVAPILTIAPQQPSAPASEAPAVTAPGPELTATEAGAEAGPEAQPESTEQAEEAADIGDGAKAEEAPLNKAEDAAPANKASTGRKAK